MGSPVTVPLTGVFGVGRAGTIYAPGLSFIDNNAELPSVRWSHLFRLDLADSLCWTDDTLPVFWNDTTWLPYVVKPTGISTEQGVVAVASMTIGNADALFGAYMFTADLTGAVITVWEAWLDALIPGQIPKEVRQVFVGRVTSVGQTRQGQGADVTLGLGPYSDPATKLLPQRLTASLIRQH